MELDFHGARKVPVHTENRLTGSFNATEKIKKKNEKRTFN